VQQNASTVSLAYSYDKLCFFKTVPYRNYKLMVVIIGTDVGGRGEIGG